MKRIIYRLFTIAVFTFTASGLTSCGDWLDINTNEKAVTKTTPGLLFSYSALNFSGKRMGGDQFFTLIWSSQIISDGNIWFEGDSMYIVDEYPTGNAWVSTYSSAGMNLLNAIRFAEQAEAWNTVAQCKIFLAAMLWETTMLFGDIPYSEAWRIEEIKAPHFDPQRDVLYGAIGLIDEALGLIDDDSEAIVNEDFFYKGDMDKWKKLAKSLKLRTMLYIVNREPAIASEIGTLVNAGGLLGEGDDFAFPYYDVPGNKNPVYRFIEQYGYWFVFFASPYVLDPMLDYGDPRIPFYFMKGKSTEATDFVSIAPGEDAEEGDDKLLITSNVNYETLFAATYPDVLMSYQEVQFYLAEVYARGLGVAKDLATADAHYRNGIKAACLFHKISETDAQAYADSFPDLSTLSDDEVNYAINIQQWIDGMVRPLEAWSNQRRTLVPELTVPASMQGDYADVIHRWPYPSRESGVNPNVPQVEGIWTRMWFEE